MTQSSTGVSQLLVSLADDELILAHRDSEWTGHSPILEEDIAFSNIAQDEMGHALVWYSLNEQITGQKPDALAFGRAWEQFRCCSFVSRPIGDFAYTVVRQFLFDMAEQVRLASLAVSTHTPIREAAAKILKEEGYHRLHTQGLLERLSNGTEESHRRMQAALNAAFPQAAGIFEDLPLEPRLIAEGVMQPNKELAGEWQSLVTPILAAATLTLPPDAPAGFGGRNGKHPDCLRDAVTDMQSVFRSIDGASW